MAQRVGSSSITYKWTYDVFLSFHGEDTRLGFIGYLREALRQRGIHAFIDDEGIRTGEEITPALFRAIQESRIAIIVFSENYANSTFCLKELEKILECFKEEGRVIYPVFYYVDPSELRCPRGSYAEALAKLEERFKDNKDQKVEKWRLALSQAANLKGCHLKPNITNEQEGITEIISEVSARINHDLLDVTSYPVGLVPRVKEVVTLLELRSIEETKMIGIWGPGGIGKSTIARALYNGIAVHFEGLCFLSNVRKMSQKRNGLPHLQETLLRKLVMEKDLKLGDFHEGIPIIKRRLGRKKILLILDDVDELVQLEALAGSCDWFGLGSRVIITTRNKQLLVSHTHVKCIYEVRKLNKEESLQLLSWHAFKKENVESDFIEVSNHAILYSCGFPLALEVIGSDLCGKGVDQWSVALDQFKAIPHGKVLKVVQLSYDALGEFEKKVFLDLACFFNGEKLGDVKCRLLYLHEIPPENAINVLMDKSLIKIEGDCVIMHDLMEDMGKEIVRRESQDEPGERSRLWFYRDILQVLQHDIGTNKVKAIVLDLPQGNEVHWSGEAFVKMKNLKMLVIKNACFPKGPIYLPNSLRWLEWEKYPFRFLPLDFCPIELVYLNLSYSYVDLLQLPFDKKFESLKYMNFKSCKSLQEIPDLSRAFNLIELCLDDCTSLTKIHDSVGSLSKLSKLSAMRCKNLKVLPLELSMESLEHLNLLGCSSLQYFPKILVKMTKMRKLDLDRTAIVELPSSISKLVGLEILNMEECHHLKQLPASIFMLPKLWFLCTSLCHGMSDLKICEDREEASIDSYRNGSSKMEYFYFSNCNLTNEFLALCLSCFPNLIQLDLSCGKFTTLPACIEECCNMTSLILDNCKQLQYIFGMPPNLKKFSAINCKSLTMISKGRVLDKVLFTKEGKLNYVFPEKEFPEDLMLNKVSSSPLSFSIGEKFSMILIWIMIINQPERPPINNTVDLDISVRIDGVSHKVLSEQWFSSFTVDHLYIFDLFSIINKAELELSKSFKWNGRNHVEIFVKNNIQDTEIHLGTNVGKQGMKLENNLQPVWGHDVFLSFQASDHDSYFFKNKLYGALCQNNIKAFNAKFRREEGILPTVVKAIEESRISIIVFSKSYAHCKWCLDALAMIIDCMKTKGKLVFSIFYDVYPLEVRHQSGSFAVAMAEHAEYFKNDMEKVQRWEFALSKATCMRRWSLGKWSEDEDIPRIVEEVSRRLLAEHLTKSVESIGSTMGDQGPRHDVLILSFKEACRDSYIFSRRLDNALCMNDINAFNYVGSSGWNADLCPTMAKAIEESRISIIVFSESYAHCTWCLDVLAMIIDCMKKKGKLVFPIFCGIDPSDVRYQLGSFGIAMAEHSKNDTEKAERWKSALREAACMSGWSIEKWIQNFSEVIPHIVEAVSWRLRLEHLTKPIEPIGNTLGHGEQPQDREELKDDTYRNLYSIKPSELIERIMSHHEGPRHDVLILSFGDTCSDIFADDVYNALYENNINAFKVVVSIKWNEDSDPTSLRAIEESRILIIVFSNEFFTYSPSRDDTLVMILDCMKTKSKLVLPIFYDVDLSDARLETSRWKSEMEKRRGKFLGYTNEEKLKLKSACLKQLAGLVGD
ncbi:TMV resistance protein N-like [Prosopis cineraria]|uniref:TMV resistance protein N-like n=1 Tax=Prosopis cineraria TaxID=364024 RepID=UPI00241012DD|nr:TMV resistance protein N-like [Prosopis cineraria]